MQIVKKMDREEHRSGNITFTQAGVSCFVGQESGKFEVQFFVGKLSGKNPCQRIAESHWHQAKKRTNSAS
jgi:hypothetical protein